MEWGGMEAEVRRGPRWSIDSGVPGSSPGVARLPNVVRSILVGRSVLDVECGSGGYALAALRAGARRAIGIDSVDRNIEEARGRARELGLADASNVEWSVSAPKEYLGRDADVFDYVFLCDVLANRGDAATLIAMTCRAARRGVLVTTKLAGGAAGEYTVIADEGRLPNDPTAIAAEFERFGFLPLHVAESRARTPDGTWGRCSLLVEAAAKYVATGDAPSEEVDLHVLARPDARTASEVALDVTLYNRTKRALAVRCELALLDGDGAPVADPVAEQLVLTPRVAVQEGSASESVRVPVRRPVPREARAPLFAEARAFDSDGRPIARRRVRV